jgi:hypothetical protein
MLYPERRLYRSPALHPICSARHSAISRDRSRLANRCPLELSVGVREANALQSRSRTPMAAFHGAATKKRTVRSRPLTSRCVASHTGR